MRANVSTSHLVVVGITAYVDLDFVDKSVKFVSYYSSTVFLGTEDGLITKKLF